MKLYKAARRNSGLSLRIKQLFGKDSRWMKAWILLSKVAFGHDNFMLMFSPEFNFLKFFFYI